MTYPRLEIGFDFGANNEISFKTVVIELGNGTEQRLAQYQSPLTQIQFGDRHLSTHQMHQSFQYLQRFFRERKGSQDAFAVRDWSDYEARSQPTRRLTATTYLLEKEYGDLACPVRLPVLSKLEIFVNGNKLTSGYSVNADDGIITFTSSKSTTDIVTWSGEFDRLCRFGEDKIEVRNLGYSPDLDIHILQISSLRARELPNKYPPRNPKIFLDNTGFNYWGNWSGVDHIDINGWLPNNEISKWMSFTQDTNLYAFSQDFYYDVTYSFISQSAGTVVGRAIVDNEIVDVVVNDVSTGIKIAGNYAGSWVNFTININLGRNEIVFKIKNKFSDGSTNPTACRVEWEVSA